MTDWVTKNLKSTVTYWTPGVRDMFGATTFSKSTIKGRWEERAEQFLDRTGQGVISRAVVYVDTDITLDGFLLEGTSTAADPTTLGDTAFQIRGRRKLPDLKKTGIFERKAFL